MLFTQWRHTDIFLCYPGFLRQQYYITADSNRLLKSAYIGVHVQRCPRLLHLLLIVMHWGRRRRLNGNSRHSFLSDENLATLFVVFCERSGFIHEVTFFCWCEIWFMVHTLLDNRNVPQAKQLALLLFLWAFRGFISVSYGHADHGKMSPHPKSMVIS